MRILIYGAGVIGCLYGALLSEAGHFVRILARGKRLESLMLGGLQYRAGQEVKTARVTILSRLDTEDAYDFILLTVREDQVNAALEELKANISPTIVTMVNALGGYETWERICGAGRILPAFPGAGGGWEDGVLDAALTPRLVQPTTFGEIGGRTTPRLRQLARLFKSAGIPYQIVPDMQNWQLCHLAMVVPIADAYYAAADPALAGKDFSLMRRTARQIKENLRLLRTGGMKLSPKKMHLLVRCPDMLMAKILSRVFQSDFGDRFMYRHSMKAPQEMRRLHEQLYAYLGTIKEGEG